MKEIFLGKHFGQRDMLDEVLLPCCPHLSSLRRPDPISCRKWDVSYFTTLKKKITNIYVAYAAIYSNNTLTNECWK